MSATDVAAGYPVHAVTTFRRWTNPHGVQFTEWTATCGATGTETGHRLKTAQSARWRELCRTCWPARHATYHPDPVEVRHDEQEPA